MTNEERRLDIANQLIRMGNALMIEGKERDDFTITQSGSILIVLATFMASNEEMWLFAQFCSMFTAKQTLDIMRGIDDTPIIGEIMRQKMEELPPPIEEPKKRKRGRPRNGTDSKPETE